MRLFAALAVLLAGCAGPQVVLNVQAPATLHEEPGGFERAVVTRVVDGDTIKVEVLARKPGPAAGVAKMHVEQSVRLIGIDTPESVAPGSPVECFGKEAFAAAAALLDGRTVRLVKDVEETDRYGRLLRYVYLGDEMMNARLVANGYAHAYTYPPNVRHSRVMLELERAARDDDRGLWSPDTCNGSE